MKYELYAIEMGDIKIVKRKYWLSLFAICLSIMAISFNLALDNDYWFFILVPFIIWNSMTLKINLFGISVYNSNKKIKSYIGG